MTTPHAVRWARRELRRLATLDYSKWHWTQDASFTACGRPIPIAIATTLPETDDDPQRVDCALCRRKAASAMNETSL